MAVGNEYIVTKAIPKALERCETLASNRWEPIDTFTFRGFHDYYRIKLI